MLMNRFSQISAIVLMVITAISCGKGVGLKSSSVSSSSSASIFAPYDVSNLVAWYDPKVFQGNVDNFSISSWGNSYGTFPVLNLGAGSLYRTTSGINSHPAVFMSAVGNTSISNVGTFYGMTIYMVLKASTVSTTYLQIIQNSGSTSVNKLNIAKPADNTTLDFITTGTTTSYNTTSSSVRAGGICINHCVVEAAWDGDSVQIKTFDVDGNAFYQGNDQFQNVGGYVPDFAFSTSSEIQMGSGSSYVSELLIYSRSLDSGERQRLWNYFDDKYLP